MIQSFSTKLTLIQLIYAVMRNISPISRRLTQIDALLFMSTLNYLPRIYNLYLSFLFHNHLMFR